MSVLFQSAGPSSDKEGNYKPEAELHGGSEEPEVKFEVHGVTVTPFILLTLTLTLTLTLGLIPFLSLAGLLDLKSMLD